MLTARDDLDIGVTLQNIQGRLLFQHCKEGALTGEGAERCKMLRMMHHQLLLCAEDGGVTSSEVHAQLSNEYGSFPLEPALRAEATTAAVEAVVESAVP